MSVKSYTSSGLGEGVSENSQNIGSQQQDKTSTPVPLVTESTKAPIDLFQLPGAPTAQPVSTVQPSVGAPSPPVNFHQPPQTYSSTPTDLFAGNLGQKPTSGPPDLPAPSSGGWASFENPVPAAKPTNIIASAGVPELEVKNEGIPQPSTSMQWPPLSSILEQHALSVSSPWQDDHSEVVKNVAHNPPWNAFPDSVEASSLDNANHFHQHGPSNSQSNSDQHHLPQVEELSNDGTQTGAGSSGFGFPGNTAPAYSPYMEESWQPVNDQKSANPFDLPYDSEYESNDMFLDMSSLQGALPEIQNPPTFFNDVSLPWLAPDSVPSYLPPPAGTQGGLAYMAGQASTPQLQNPAAQGHVASTGGNPFA